MVDAAKQLDWKSFQYGKKGSKYTVWEHSTLVSNLPWITNDCPFVTYINDLAFLP